MSETNIPDPAATHDPFQAPVMPDEISGAEVNKRDRELHEAAATLLADAESALAKIFKKLPDARGHRIVAGASSALGQAQALVKAEAQYVAEQIQKLPPVPVEEPVEPVAK